MEFLRLCNSRTHSTISFEYLIFKKSHIKVPNISYKFKLNKFKINISLDDKKFGYDK
jgi:hypothetical protein